MSKESPLKGPHDVEHPLTEVVFDQPEPALGGKRNSLADSRRSGAFMRFLRKSGTSHDKNRASIQLNAPAVKKLMKFRAQQKKIATRESIMKMKKHQRRVRRELSRSITDEENPISILKKSSSTKKSAPIS